MLHQMRRLRCNNKHLVVASAVVIVAVVVGVLRCCLLKAGTLLMLVPLEIEHVLLRKKLSSIARNIIM